MWLVGFVIGAALGASLDGLLRWNDAWLFFGAIGAIVAIGLKTGRLPAPAAFNALEARVAALERQVSALKARESMQTSAPEHREEPVVAAEPPAAFTTPPEEQAPPVADPAAAPLSATPPEAAGPPPELLQLWQKLVGGNILAKIGVLLLLVGIGSGLKLAIDFGMFPPSVRLLMATVAGLGMVAFGYSRTHLAAHRMFGLALQGGGFGVLYLVTYFAFARYGFLGAASAFALFAGLGIGCLALALRFEGEPLAMLGISGAFLAPLLASTGAGSHVVLFSYYAVLDALVLAINVLRLWRMLMVTAFAFTMVIGMTWASERFVPALFGSTEAFLILYAVVFSLAPVVPLLVKRTSQSDWAQWALIFGTPVAAAVAQSWVLEQSGFGRVALAWSAAVAGAYYAVLAGLLHLRHAAADSTFAHGAIAVGFITLAVPFAFGVQVTSAFWGIEGLALAWFGLARSRLLAYIAGLLLQLGAGTYFIAQWSEPRMLPVLNATYIGALVVAICGASTAWLTKSSTRAAWLHPSEAESIALLVGLWAIAWWLGANLADIGAFAPPAHETALQTAVLIATAWGMLSGGRALEWPAARYAALLLSAVSVLPALIDTWPYSAASRHPLHDTMVFAVPAAFAMLYYCLLRNERDGLTGLAPAVHVYALLLLGVVTLLEVLWIARQLAPRADVWRVIAWQLVPAVFAYLVVHFERQRTWPVDSFRGAYVLVAAPVLLTIAFSAALIANLGHSGGGTGLPYLPVASFFDAAQLGVLFAAIAWTRCEKPLAAMAEDAGRALIGVLAFVWFSGMALRLAHHWGGVPFNPGALLASGMAQSLLSLTWTALALTLMISATRSLLRQRWFLGFALLGVVGAKFMLVDVVNKGTVTWTLSLIGVGLLILAASYFSPAPPRAAAPAQA